MSRRPTNRRIYDITIEPSAASLLESHAKPSNSRDNARNDQVATTHLPNYFALNFNFKPDSTHDCKKGALFQSGPSRSQSSDWQLELESNEVDNDANGEGGSKKPAHVFTGPQTAAKAYDLVLVWDAAAKVYRLDRVAASFALKYERSKTVLSGQSQDVWERDAVKPKTRPTQDSSTQQRIASTSLKRDHSSLIESSGASASSSSSRSGELKLRSKTSTVVAPVRRSSRRSIAVEMEEFEDQPESSAGPSATAAGNTPKQNNTTREVKPGSKDSVKKTKDLAPKVDPAPAPSQDSASGLRRSRRRSSQAQGEASSSSPQQPRTPTADSQTAATEATPAPGGLEGDDDDLALELERELEREFEIEMEDVSEHEEPAPPAGTEPTSSVNRSLSPATRLDAKDKEAKVNTPKAHTPDAEDIAAPRRPSALSNEIRRSCSPLTDRSTPLTDGRAAAPASIGLGLQQTGVGITPTASPRLDVPSPRQTSPVKEDNDGVVEAAKASDSVAREDDDEDDDLDDFAAELDMSLAEVPDASPVIAAPPVVEKRRSSRAYTQSTDTSRQVRKAYGLGGPRQEEEELEDSD